ncbi:MAG: OmpH family outer membrane protein [Bacteroidetes bacterium]|nr:OmpH family outer membrane protein [Flavobacteriales bacterium]NOG95940.1 OmpH family outer membrane protein [Bacteroidota bacterium]WKZ75124.1 MAG: OmpH family outer membrane protein [Vicingaceae bacterium]CAG0963368.1 Chaperone protein Skp [Flavobacteriales bacterium]
MIKKILFAGLIFLSVASFAQKTQKLGHINSNELLMAMPERTKIQKDLEDYAKQLQSQLQTMETEWQGKVQDFKAKEGQMTELIRNTKVKEITDLEQRIQDFQETAQKDLQNKEGELLQPLIDKAKKAIEDVAKENGFTYILDSSVGVLLYTAGEDILPLVKKNLKL